MLKGWSLDLRMESMGGRPRSIGVFGKAGRDACWLGLNTGIGDGVVKPVGLNESEGVD